MSDIQELGCQISALNSDLDASVVQIGAVSKMVQTMRMMIQQSMQGSLQGNPMSIIRQLELTQAKLEYAMRTLLTARTEAENWTKSHAEGGADFGGDMTNSAYDLVTNSSEDSSEDYSRHLSSEEVNNRWKTTVENIDEQINNYRDALHARGVPDCTWLDKTLAKHRAAMLEQEGYNLDAASGYIKDTIHNKNAYCYPADYNAFYNQLADSFRTYCAQNTNPNYKPRTKWSINCQRCVPTYELLRRGMDVTVLPCESSPDYLASHPFAVWKNPQVIYCSDAGSDEIESAMKSWGDGTRAQVVVMWTETQGHTFIAEQIDGVTHYIDPQSGNEVYDDWIVSALPGKTRFCRIDNLETEDLIKDCYQEVA